MSTTRLDDSGTHSGNRYASRPGGDRPESAKVDGRTVGGRSR
jgi:hypothetical protein